MEVEAKVDVSCKQFFDYLVQMHIDAAKQASKKVITRQQILDGISYDIYTAFDNVKRTIPIHVGPVLEDRYFEVTYQTVKSSVRYFYDLTRIDNDHCKIVYHEETKEDSDKGSGILRNIQKGYGNMQAGIAAHSAINKIVKAIKAQKQQ